MRVSPPATLSVRCPVITPISRSPDALLALPSRQRPARIASADAILAGRWREGNANSASGDLEIGVITGHLTLKVAGGDTRIESVGRVFGMSARTLQRRLADEGLSFQKLLDDARKVAAGRYLDLSLIHI